MRFWRWSSRPKLTTVEVSKDMIAVCVVENGAEDGIKLGSGEGVVLCEGVGD